MWARWDIGLECGNGHRLLLSVLVPFVPLPLLMDLCGTPVSLAHHHLPALTKSWSWIGDTEPMADPPNTPTHLFIGVLTQGEAKVDICLSRTPEHFPGSCPPDLTPVYSRDISHFIVQNITEEISAQDSWAGDIILGFSAW